MVPEGFGTALKPALEPITVARKPFKGTVAANVLEHGTGGINIDGCRVGSETIKTHGKRESKGGVYELGHYSRPPEWEGGTHQGRWPANMIHDGSDEVVGLFPVLKGAGSQRSGNQSSQTGEGGLFGVGNHPGNGMRFGDTGSAARFFYTAKATRAERQGCTHPTVKPLDLMAYLCRLVTPPSGTVLDPFMGSGTTIKAALSEGFNAIGIERDPAYFAMAEHRMNGTQLGLGLDL
jgi:site-specific DNA-methyltransferase (adenine-specific)